MGKFLDLKWAGGNKLGFDPNRVANALVEDVDAFREIGERVFRAVRSQYAMAFVNTKATADRKARGKIERDGGSHGHSGSNTMPGFSSMDTFRNLSFHSNKAWAGVWRGNDEWYAFLHDRGVGYAYWSVDGRMARGDRMNEPGRKRAHRGSRSTTGREAFRFRESRAGTTKFTASPFMHIDSATESFIWARVEKAIQNNIDTKPIFGGGI